MAIGKGRVPAGGEKDTAILADCIRQIHQNAVGGPASPTDNTVPKFNALGQLEASGVTIDDSNNLAGIAALTMSGLLTLNTTGQIKFPATPSVSSNANTLDDIEWGLMTPGFTFATPGDLALTLSLQEGYYLTIGKLVAVAWALSSSAFTWSGGSGATGNGIITGLPFASALSFNNRGGAMSFRGITKANYTQFVMSFVTGTTTAVITASGSGQAETNCQAADFPSGGTLTLRGTGLYFKA
jgi:hypothetical protein